MAQLSHIPVLVLFLALPLIAEQDAARKSASSPWLRKQFDPRKQGCRFRSWICNEGGYPVKSVCCGNRCVDISSDDANCGRCGFRCKFSHKCCSGLCVDLSRNPLHCGQCSNRCSFMSPCSFGLCGYAEPPLPPYMPPPPPYSPPPPPLYVPPPPAYSPPAPPLYVPPPPPPLYTPLAPPLYTPPIPPYLPPGPPFCTPPGPPLYVPPPPYSLYPPPMVPLPPGYSPSKALRNAHHCRMPPNASGVAA